MADPYTVGIALALDNGVSEGLASICQDFGTLNRAIDNSATGLKQLRQIADQMKVGSIPRQAAPGLPWSPVSLPGNAHVRLASPPAAEDARLSNNQGHAGPFIQLGPGAQGDVSALSRSGATGQSATAPAQRLKTSLSVSPASSPGVVSAAGNAEFDRTAVSPARVLDRVQTWLSRSDPSSSRLAVGPIPSKGMDRSANVAPMVEPQPPRQPVGSADNSGSDKEQDSHGLAAMSAPRSPAKQTPTAFEAAHSPSPATQSTAVFPVLPSSVPPPAESQGAPLQGDVYLDGTLLGRWIVDHLTRSMDRPRAGITGFDPRLTATWPGAPIGT
jgi:hypothetical protein